MVVLFMQGNAMVAIPAVKHGFLFSTRYGACLVERALGVVGFPCSVNIQGLEVNRASRLAIFLGADHHPVALGDGLTNRDRFNDT